MRILMLSWEYPPKSVGGLSTHVYYLAQELTKLGHEIHLITCEAGAAPKQENDNGVFIYRVEPYNIDTGDFIKWVMQLNFAIIEVATRLITQKGPFNLIHSHDWLTAFSSKALKWSHDIPLISTIHATEYGRNNGIFTEMQKYISATEWLLGFESFKVIVCSEYMRRQLKDIFNIPSDKISVIPNGVNYNEFEIEFNFKEFRANYAQEDEEIVFYVGRHVFEKGVHVLIEAAPQIVNGYKRTKFIIGGRGPMTEELKARVQVMGLSDKFHFLGYVEDEVRNKLYRISDVAVFPSLYEPFGIVALEAMSAGCPVVVSDTGGLSEIVEHDINGLKCFVGSPQSLGDNVLKILNDKELRGQLKKNSLKDIQLKYNWSKIANSTVEAYNTVIEKTIGSRRDNN
ncbi:MAG: glycosyltransferase family 4 protein [Clostridiaceae bacterium]|nr:glycosyltransferase family 4 protein [Clostridiaceae bacterium]